MILIKEEALVSNICHGVEQGLRAKGGFLLAPGDEIVIKYVLRVNEELEGYLIIDLSGCGND